MYKNQPNNRSLLDKIKHWWPGYWRGLFEGLIYGFVIGAVSMHCFWPH